MSGDIIKDYLNAFLGALAIFLSLVFIPEIRAKLKYILGVLVICSLLVWLGIDKIHRDDRKDATAERKRKEDSAVINRINSLLQADTARFSDFKRKLEKDFHIKDSNNTPVQIHNYKPTFNTHIDKAENVKIGYYHLRGRAPEIVA